MNGPGDGSSGRQCREHGAGRHRPELRALSVHLDLARRPGRWGPQSGQLSIDPVADLPVDLFEERLNDGITVLRPELVMDLCCGTDLVRDRIESSMPAAWTSRRANPNGRGPPERRCEASDLTDPHHTLIYSHRQEWADGQPGLLLGPFESRSMFASSDRTWLPS